MRSKPKTVLAMALMALALLSGAWTASMGGAGSPLAVAASVGSSRTLPGGASVPSGAIESPASVPVPGVIAPSVPRGGADAVVSSASSTMIPPVALAAYQRGAEIIDAADTTCHLSWELLAAIGRVESDHGRYGGSTLSPAGVATPGIYGPELDGTGATAAVEDTDGGVLDGDPVHDRAVGPMQFIPSTWQVVKVDADGDGKRDPQDIDDASLATAVYLCSGTSDLATRKGQEAAVFRYNHSTAYVDLVLRITQAYGQGDYSAVPSGSYGDAVLSRTYSTALSGPHHQASAEQTEAGAFAHDSVAYGAPLAAPSAAATSPADPTTIAPGPSSADASDGAAPAGAPSPSPDPTDGPPGGQPSGGAGPTGGGAADQPGEDPSASPSSSPTPAADPTPGGSPFDPTAAPAACGDNTRSLAAGAVGDYLQPGQQPASAAAPPSSGGGCADQARTDLGECLDEHPVLATAPVGLATCVEALLGGAASRDPGGFT